MFGRHDVDKMLEEMSHEAFAEWCAFLQLEPQGWDAKRFAAGHVAYWLAQVQSRKRLKPANFVPRMQADRPPEASVALQRARAEAFAISSEIEQQLRASQVN